MALVTTVYELRCQIFAFTLAVFRIHLNMWGRALLFGHCGQVGWMAHTPNAPLVAQSQLTLPLNHSLSVRAPQLAAGLAWAR